MGDERELNRLNNWLMDWNYQNLPYKGANWKCGQEASIRLMHLCLGALILKQTNKPSETLIKLIFLHLIRIESTLNYALSLDNNHGTSEAAALFIGGIWLKKLGYKSGNKWSNLGRAYLEILAQRLIEEDGSFSQYSLNYHRLFLDTFCIVEIWRKHIGAAQMSNMWYNKSRVATDWLFNMINKWNGDGPNLGANDGALLLPLTNSDYRDFRPTVQMASVLFYNKKAYKKNGPWNEQLRWLEVDVPDENINYNNYNSKIMNNGGYCILRHYKTMVMLRFPRFRFRPSHADALHVDLWYKNINLLSDAGSFSYNTEKKWLDYFSSSKSHNTVEFDDRDQMPKLSRFLYGNWIKTNITKELSVNKNSVSITRGYKDSKGAQHTRSIFLEKNLLKVVDEVSGFKNKALLRWRLDKDKWKLFDTTLQNIDNSKKIVFKSDVQISNIQLVTGWNSLYYQNMKEIPVLELEINDFGKITTEYYWSL